MAPSKSEGRYGGALSLSLLPVCWTNTSDQRKMPLSDIVTASKVPFAAPSLPNGKVIIWSFVFSYLSKMSTHSHCLFLFARILARSICRQNPMGIWSPAKWLRKLSPETSNSWGIRLPGIWRQVQLGLMCQFLATILSSLNK